MVDRDYFAAAALTGLLANSIAPDKVIDAYSQMAFQYADAMLRERDNHIPDAGKMVKTAGNIQITYEELKAVEAAIRDLELYADEMGLSETEVLEYQSPLRSLLQKLQKLGGE